MKKYLLVLFSLLVFVFAGAKILNEPKDQFKDGDIVFQSSKSGQSLAVQYATGSKYSHVGIIFLKEGKPYVLEAVEPVKITPLAEFKKHGDGGKIVVKRLENRELTANEIAQMKVVYKAWIGLHYDIYFSWDDSQLYCSELVWKLYNKVCGLELGERKPLKAYNLTDPVVKSKLEERYGNNIPWDELMISPGAIFDSELLKTVYQN